MAMRPLKVYFTSDSGISQDSVSRVFSIGDTTCILLVNASVSGFEKCNSETSAIFLETLVKQCRTLSDATSADAIMSTAFDLYKAGDLSLAYWVTVVLLNDDRVQVAWNSGDEVWNLSDGMVCMKTLSHSLRRKNKQFPDVLTSGFGPEFPARQWDLKMFTIEAGDRVIVLGRNVIKHLELESPRIDDVDAWLKENIKHSSAASEPYALSVLS